MNLLDFVSLRALDLSPILGARYFSPAFFPAAVNRIGAVRTGQEAQSDLPALGYTVPYAIGNIVLTAWGPVLVAMMT